MLKFLFGGKKTTPEVVIETDRARFERLVAELNEVIDTLPHKPRVTLDPATGHILPETPEQFADEALALPASESESATEPTPEPEAVTEDDAVDAAPAKPTPPVPTPPAPTPPTPQTPPAN